MFKQTKNFLEFQQGFDTYLLGFKARFDSYRTQYTHIFSHYNKSLNQDEFNKKMNTIWQSGATPAENIAILNKYKLQLDIIITALKSLHKQIDSYRDNSLSYQLSIADMQRTNPKMKSIFIPHVITLGNRIKDLNFVIEKCEKLESIIQEQATSLQEIAGVISIEQDVQGENPQPMRDVTNEQQTLPLGYKF